jgi:cytochrome c oxidase cbb3-type subunit 3
MTSGWSWFVVVLTLGNIAGALWLLLTTSRAKGAGSSAETTGHRWDGDLTELNRPLPRWWYYLFLLSCAWGLAYLVFYPGLGNFRGVLGWDQESQHAAEEAAVARAQAPRYARFAALPLPELARDPDAMATARSLYATTCTACHGSDARGAPGFPDLTDADWLYGSEPDTLLATIADGRTGVMPPWEAVLGDKGIAEVVSYLRSLHGEPADAAAQSGAAAFATYCAACHGADAKGNHALGAPDLTDAVWLYGGDPDTLRRSIAAGRTGSMPAHRPALGDDRVRLLAAYVLSLGADGMPAGELQHGIAGGR